MTRVRRTFSKEFKEQVVLLYTSDYGQPNVPPLTFFLPPNDKECTSK